MTYTTLALIAAAVAVLLDLVLLRTRVLLTRRYWLFFGVMTVFFLVVNGILTALPVVAYSSHAIIGVRLYTIPIEDIAYMFALVTPTIAIYERLGRSRREGNSTT